ncbi:MAG: hypothetical protein VB074_16215 [Proteiniphilum sp.]|jgi:hypothetical protein|uniref:hypothetical protein n=1 Tax=Proteiniphilum sp. TaxID=1926877 RepID=UPI00092A95EC|nr:hypothetical protein [Proteiniphilum sp.]MEA5129721.1 hypothetical protein [Proteiniphilum sp.]OJV80633.1 MAG: hypothetical protein BGO34_19755 [Bacteroidia bacterium 44-10]
MDTKINKLEEIDKTKNPFKVPENYFAQFNQEIMDRLPEKEIVVPEPVSMWDRAKPWVYLAAMFVGLYITINFLMKTPGNDNMTENQIASQQTLSGSYENTDNYWSTVQITEEEFYQYLEEQLVDDSYFDYMYHQYYLN